MRTLRYREVEAAWYSETGERHEQTLSGFIAQVFQHETDHLDGILFVDKVRDTRSFVMADEYHERIAKK